MVKPPKKKPEAKAEKKAKLTDTERHKRFVDMAHSVEASNSAKDFEDAFKKVLKSV